MSKIKYSSIALLAVGIVASSFWVWHNHSKRRLSQNTHTVQGAYTEQPLTQSDDPDSIPLNSLGGNTKSMNGLSVAPSSSANNLGQLTPNSDGTTNPNNSSSSAPKALDPATFSQYNKYKDDDTALFGDLQIGTGDELIVGKKAAVNYKGWLTDGRLFDATRADKDGKLQPFVFEMGSHQVISGWEQGLLGMKVGGTRLVIVPPAVGYGANGQDPIPGNAVLVFQVQLLAVQ